jgi:hypothetical protein
MSEDSPTHDKTYTGPERRKGPRRSGTDRRELVRFEVEKDPRRSGKDRRAGNQDLWDKRDF